MWAFAVVMQVACAVVVPPAVWMGWRAPNGWLAYSCYVSALALAINGVSFHMNAAMLAGL